SSFSFVRRSISSFILLMSSVFTSSFPSPSPFSSTPSFAFGAGTAGFFLGGGGLPPFAPAFAGASPSSERSSRSCPPPRGLASACFNSSTCLLSVSRSASSFATSSLLPPADRGDGGGDAFCAGEDDRDSVLRRAANIPFAFGFSAAANFFARPEARPCAPAELGASAVFAPRGSAGEALVAFDGGRLFLATCPGEGAARSGAPAAAAASRRVASCRARARRWFSASKVATSV
ncbi:hypothetical protein TGDOM2_400240, partial [Toxoplasma gondii GAB2-2007-GAL-DOM2]